MRRMAAVRVNTVVGLLVVEYASHSLVLDTFPTVRFSAVNAVSATVTNGLVLNGTARLGDTNSGYGALSFSGAQTWAGNSPVHLGGGPSSFVNAERLAVEGTTLAIGPGIQVRGAIGTRGHN